MENENLGTSSKDSLKKTIKARLNFCQQFYSDWTEEAKEDYDFARGKQWTDEDRQSLADQKRPCLTFNRIKPYINIIAGYQRENSARIKVNPEGGEDRVFSEVCDKMIRAIDKWSHLTYKLGYLFDDGLYCGRGHLEGIRHFEDDPINGDLKFKLSGPYQILVDPDCDEYDINEGAEYLFKLQKFTKGKLKQMYPNFENKIDGMQNTGDDMEYPVMTEGDADNYGNNPNKVTVINESDMDEDGNLDVPDDEKLLHVEYWYKKYTKKFFVLDRETGLPIKFETQEEAQAFIDEQKARQDIPDLYNDEVKIFERTLPEMWVASMVGTEILRDIKSPLEPEYPGFPFFRFLADWAPSADREELRVEGIPRSLKDPQREKNKSHSSFLHILSTQANSGWIGDEDVLTEEGWKKLEELGAMPGITVKKVKKDGYLERISPSPVPQGHYMQEQIAGEEFKAISDVNPDLLGMQERTTSGKAISLRIKQAVTALSKLFFNYHYTKQSVGIFILKMIPAIFTVPRMKRVLGDSYIKSVMESEKYGPMIQGITDEVQKEAILDGILSGFLQIIKDHRYDVDVTEADKTATIRHEIFEQLIDLAGTSQGAYIPVELILEYMEIGNYDEVKKKIEQARQQALAAQAPAK